LIENIWSIKNFKKSISSKDKEDESLKGKKKPPSED
jgi:hypothetical protein